MPSKKDRLYVALYVRGGGPKTAGLEDTYALPLPLRILHFLYGQLTMEMVSYHWALIIGPKDESKNTERGTKYHAKNVPLGPAQTMWEFETRTIALGAVEMLLIRIVVGKVLDKHRAEEAMRRVPIVQGDADWNCIAWVQKALEALQKDGKAVGTSQLDWRTVKDAAMRYAQDKKDQHRFEVGSGFDTSKPANFDLLTGREVVP
ncbi:hypothetical protein P7C71_g5487, partial [Lecanoromycetidae sp. Uapishka_2]